MHVLFFLAVVLALLVAGGRFFIRRSARQFLRVRGRKTPTTPRDLGLRHTDFSIAGPEGTLRGWFLLADDAPRPTLVLAHGWQSNAGDMVPWAAPLVASGHHVVLFDTIGHGESDASEFTSIRHYRDDLAAVVQWVMTQPLAAPGVAVMGHSMGGAAAILVAARDPRIFAVVTAGAPTDPLSITREWLAAKGMPADLMVAMMRPHWARIVRTPFEDVNPLTEIGRVQCPLLVMHGARDRHVGVHHAEALAAARHASGRPDATVVIYPEGDHHNLPKIDGYARAINDFLAAAHSLPV